MKVTLPTGWVGFDLEQGVDDVGARTFPGDPALAAGLQNMLNQYGKGAVFGGLAMTPRPPPATAYMLLFPDDPSPVGRTLEQQGEADLPAVRAQGGSIIESGLVHFPALDVFRITAHEQHQDAALYIVKGTDRAWIALYGFRTLTADNLALADGSASTIVVP